MYVFVFLFVCLYKSTLFSLSKKLYIRLGNFQVCVRLSVCCVASSAYARSCAIFFLLVQNACFSCDCRFAAWFKKLPNSIFLLFEQFALVCSYVAPLAGALRGCYICTYSRGGNAKERQEKKVLDRLSLSSTRLIYLATGVLLSRWCIIIDATT